MTDVAIILPQRERYARGEAGAIALMVARLATPDDRVLGMAPTGEAFSAGRFCAVVPARFGISDAARYARGCVTLLRRETPALIEVHNRPDVASIVARALPGVPVLLVLHNDPCRMRGARLARARGGLLKRMRVAGVSAWVRARFLEGVAPGADVALLPNGIDRVSLPPARAHGARSDEILFAGRVVADKGADAFVRACAAVLPRHPRWRARMIGADRFASNAPPTPFITALTPQAQAAGVRMDGYLPHDAVLEAMARAAIVVVPSRWPEPFGLTALEAMASGAALVAAPVGGMAEVVGNAALLALPDPPGALEDALERLIGDAALRAMLAARGLARAEAFDVTSARARLAALRSDMLSRGRGRVDDNVIA